MKHVFLLKFPGLRLWRHGLVLCTLMLFGAFGALAQEIRGKITDEAGEPLPGVSILVKGTTAGTASDAQGQYTLSIPEGEENPVLVYSFIGYSSEERIVGDQTNIDLSMLPSIEALSEVIVVGYGVQKKSDVTGAVARLDETALKDVPVANATQALQGRIAGVDIIQTNSRPGGSANIRIRGSRSLPNPNDPDNVDPPNNDPLIVVNGIPYNGNINDLNPSDIVSMDVLKDASATAIYGSRGSNGVIIVTTKRGVPGQLQLTYDGYHGVNSVIDKYDVFNGDEYQQFMSTAATNGFTSDENESIAEGSSVDWQDLLYTKGFITNHQIGASGGTENTQYSLGAGYFKQTSAFEGIAFTRYSLSTSLDQKIGDRVRVGLNSLNSLNVNDGEDFDPMFTLLTMSPLYKAYNDDGTINKFPAVGSADPLKINPLYFKDETLWKQQRRIMRTFNSLFGEIDIVEGLKYRINVGLDYYSNNLGEFQSANSPFRDTQDNTAVVRNEYSSSYTIENLLLYQKTFADVHRLNFTGLYSVQEVETYRNQIDVTQLPTDQVYYYNIGLANGIQGYSGGYAKSGLVSYMARVNYAFNDKYLLTLTGRADGSSRLAPGNQWFYYPALALGWNIMNEPFMQGVTPISNLKLRFGVGQTSNQAIAPYQSQGALKEVPISFGTSGLFAYNFAQLPNPDLSWEFTTTSNIGLDFGLFNNRLTGSLELYKQVTSDILQSRNLPSTSGVSQITQNIGESVNKGIELALSSANIDSDDPNGFKWSTDINFYLNRNEITNLASGVDRDINNGWFVGHPIDVIYDYEKIGIWQTSEAAQAAEFGAFVPGDIKVKDQLTVDTDGDGVGDLADGEYTADDRVILGSLQPNWSGGLTNRISYKGFDFSFVLFARAGGMLVSRVYQININNPINSLEGRRNGLDVDYWTPTNPTNEYPRTGLQNTPNGSTTGYFDASFMKVRSITLGYQIPASVIDRVGIKSLRVYLQAQNPFKAFFSPYVDAGGLDPETNGFGETNTPGYGNRPVVNQNTPPLKQFIFGVSLKY